MRLQTAPLGTKPKGLRRGRTLPIVITLALTLFLALTACVIPGVKAPDELNPTPRFGTADDPVDASEIWEEYQSSGNASFANDLYKRQWAWIRIDGVRAGGTGIDAITLTKVLLRTPGTISQMEFNFRFPEDTEDLERGDRPTVLCNIAGVDASGTKLVFHHCRNEE